MLNCQDHKQAENETRFTANKKGLRPTLFATEPTFAATSPQTADLAQIICKYLRALQISPFEVMTDA
jgi:hypothetical protein